MIPIVATYTPTPGEPQEEVTIVDTLFDQERREVIFIFVADHGHLGASTNYEAFTNCRLGH